MVVGEFSFAFMRNIVLKLADSMNQTYGGKVNNEHVSTGERFFDCFYIGLCFCEIDLHNLTVSAYNSLSFVWLLILNFLGVVEFIE